MGTLVSSTPNHPLVTPITPAQKVLGLPELVAQILGHLVDSYGAYSAESWTPAEWTVKDETHKATRRYLADLIKLARVNNVWLSEAMRLLWREGTELKQRSMIGLLESVKEENRQFYAALIQTAVIFEPQKGNVLASNKIVACLDFSRLKYLSIILPNSKGAQKLCLPALEAPQLKVLDIRRVAWPLWQKLNSRKQSKDLRETFDRAYFRLRSFTLRTAETLVKAIKRRFKSLEAITFGPEIMSTPQVLRYFAQELPNVQVTFYARTYNPTQHDHTLRWLNGGPLMRNFPGTRLLV